MNITIHDLAKMLQSFGWSEEEAVNIAGRMLITLCAAKELQKMDNEPPNNTPTKNPIEKTLKTENK